MKMLLCVAAGALALNTAPDMPDPRQVQKGGILYEAHCAVCHGANLQARPGMVDLRAFQGSEEDLAEAVRNGKGLMPGFSNVFTSAELAAMYAYVQSRRQLPEGD